MQCVRCGKPLKKFAVSIQTADGLVGWGRVCAETVKVRTKPKRVRIFTPRAGVTAGDPRQLDLLEAS